MVRHNSCGDVLMSGIRTILRVDIRPLLRTCFIYYKYSRESSAIADCLVMFPRVVSEKRTSVATHKIYAALLSLNAG